MKYTNLSFALHAFFMLINDSESKKVKPIFHWRNDLKCWPGSARETEIGECRSRDYFLQNLPPAYHHETVVSTPGVESEIHTFYFYYGYQDACGLFSTGEHVGDWEIVHILVVNDKVRFMTWHQHDGRYTMLDKDIPFDGPNPIVYVGKYSHGSYHDQKSKCDLDFGCFETFEYCKFWNDPRGPGVSWIPWTTPMKELTQEPRPTSEQRNPQNFPICKKKAGVVKELGITLSSTDSCERNPQYLQDESLTLNDLMMLNYYTPSLWQTDAYGDKTQGNSFNDYGKILELASSNNSLKITKIGLRSGKRIDRIEFSLDTKDTFIHGGSGGGYSSLTLDADEYLIKVEYSTCSKSGSDRVCWIRFTTDKNRVLVGGRGSAVYTVKASGNDQIVGMWGKEGAELDYLGFITYTKNNKVEGSFYDSTSGSFVTGWSCDPDEPQRSVMVRAYFGGTFDKNHFSIESIANESSGSAVSNACGGGSKHSFSIRVNEEARQALQNGDGKVYIYGIDTSGGPYNLLGSRDISSLPTISPTGTPTKSPSAFPTQLSCQCVTDCVTALDALNLFCPLSKSVSDPPGETLCRCVINCSTALEAMNEFCGN